MSGQRAAWMVWGLIYLASVSGIGFATWRGRESVIAANENAQGESNWDEWKRAAEDLAAAGNSYRRRPPTSSEPPALILLRDYFATCLVAILATFSALFVVFAWLVNGAIRGSNGATVRSR